MLRSLQAFLQVIFDGLHYVIQAQYRSSISRVTVFFYLLLAFIGFPAQAENISLSNFDEDGLQGWASKSFAGQTHYSLVDKEGKKVLKAESRAAASGLFKKIRIDLEKTPWLNWSWQVDNTLVDLDEQSKTGDDYPARVYAIVDGGLFFWQTRALNYVWASHQPKGATWSNAYTRNSKMIAIESGEDKAGRWITEKRNVREDLRRQFGEKVRYIDAIALMTDTDNTQSVAIAYYRELFFSSD